ncbi:hypothetical protein OPKNFCMD_4762 [Methylobacterium crusticola]|uniref:MFS transporter n=1 Tax=Methylobacterium crusticola TaxID=1697972 RepID=A0ABQ4R401_9HYPH|nr:hypothetical protein [Methylobacterium crusticola]GJD52001.1 hypothetical protein OPKNFCMD_4762 [Methylobacterium crusticola]
MFGPRIGADLGLSPALTYGGFSAGLLVMGLASAPVGRAIDRLGGRAVMSAGSVVTAAGLAGLSLAAGLAGLSPRRARPATTPPGPCSASACG